MIFQEGEGLLDVFRLQSKANSSTNASRRQSEISDSTHQLSQPS